MTLTKLPAIAFSLLFSAGMALAGDIQIEDSYARAASPIAKSGAAFMQISNMGAESDTLIAARTDAAMNPELHTHIMEDGIAMMREVEGGILVKAGEMTMLQRGGYHVMLMGLTQPLTHGETITIILTFEKAGEVVIEVPIDNERQGPTAEHKMNMDSSGN